MDGGEESIFSHFVTEMKLLSLHIKVCHVNLSANDFSKLISDFSNYTFVSRPKFSKTYSPSVFFKDGLKLYVFESLK